MHVYTGARVTGLVLVDGGKASGDGCLQSAARRKSAPTSAAAAADRIMCQGPMLTLPGAWCCVMLLDL
jgi:hypothetical protein